MNKSGLKTLLGDLKDMKVGTRELSDGCLKAMGWEQRRSKVHSSVTFWRSKEQAEAGEPFGECHLPRPDPSCNTQDALDWMVPEGYHLQDMRTADPTEQGSIKCHARLMYHNTNDEGRMVGSIPNACANTLPLAISATRIKLELDKLDE